MPEGYIATNIVDGTGHVVGGVDGITADFAAEDPTWRVLQGTIPETGDPFQTIVNEYFAKNFNGPSATP